MDAGSARVRPADDVLLGSMMLAYRLPRGAETPTSRLWSVVPTMVLSETSGYSQSLTALLGYPRGHRVARETDGSLTRPRILTLEPERAGTDEATAGHW